MAREEKRSRKKAIWSLLGGVIATLAALTGLLSWLDRGRPDIDIEAMLVTRGCEGPPWNLSCDQSKGEAILALSNNSDVAGGQVNLEVVYVVDGDEMSFDGFDDKIAIDASEDFLKLESSSSKFPEEILLCFYYRAGYPGWKEFKQYELKPINSPLFVDPGSERFEATLSAREDFLFFKPTCSSG